MAENLNARREKKKSQEIQSDGCQSNYDSSHLYSSTAVCFSVLLSSDVLIYTCSVAELLWEPKLWGFLDANPVESTRDDGGFYFCFNIHFFVMIIRVTKDK